MEEILHLYRVMMQEIILLSNFIIKNFIIN